MTQNPIDLKTLAGKRYRLQYDESRQGREESPWLLIVPCRYGHIYPHSAELLGIAINTRAMGHKLAKLPGVTVLQEADDGFNLACPPKLFAAVAKIMGARRKKQVSEAERNRLAAMGKATRIRPKLPGYKFSATSATGTRTGLDVSLAT